MDWAYRVVKNIVESEDEFSIREYYTNASGASWSCSPQAAHGESSEELKQDLLRMLQAFDKPIMEETTEPVSSFPILKEIVS